MWYHRRASLKREEKNECVKIAQSCVRHRYLSTPGTVVHCLYMQVLCCCFFYLCAYFLLRFLVWFECGERPPPCDLTDCKWTCVSVLHSVSLCLYLSSGLPRGSLYLWPHLLPPTLALPVTGLYIQLARLSDQDVAFKYNALSKQIQCHVSGASVSCVCEREGEEKREMESDRDKWRE